MSESTGRFTDDTSTEKLIKRLIDAGHQLPDVLRAEILGADDDMDRALMDLVADDTMHADDAPGRGWAPIHAVQLLGERRQTDAIDLLIEVVDQSHYDDIIYSRALFALIDIGTPAVEPVLQFMEDGVDDDTRDGLANVLAEAGERDERIFQILLEVLRDELPGLGASYLTDYGDPRAIEPLRETLSELEVDRRDGAALVNDDILVIGHAIEELGGEPTDDEQAKIEHAAQLRQQYADAISGDAADYDEPFVLTEEQRDEATKKLAVRRRKLRGKGKRLLKKAAKVGRYRIDRCVVNEEWKEEQFAHVIQVRSKPSGGCIVTALLVDLGCLGPKDAMFETDASPEFVDRMIDNMGEPPAECSPHLAAKIAREGALLAAHLDLPIPAEAFAVLQLFNRYNPEKADEEVVVGRYGKPYFIPGPGDDVEAILDHLDERLGPYGYEVDYPPWM